MSSSFRRASSPRVCLDKPLADIAGKPMVVRVAERALQCGASRVVVATDHASIVDACAAHGVEALLTRADHPSGTDRLAEVADLLALPDDQVVVNVQGDEPLIEPAVIDRLAATLAGSSAPDGHGGPPGARCRRFF